MSPELRAQLRAAGRAVAKELSELSDESYRRIAALLAEPINRYAKARRGGEAP